MRCFGAWVEFGARRVELFARPTVLFARRAELFARRAHQEWAYVSGKARGLSEFTRVVSGNAWLAELGGR